MNLNRRHNDSSERLHAAVSPDTRNMSNAEKYDLQAYAHNHYFPIPAAD